MSTINEQLQILEATKTQIKQALIDKNIEVLDTDSFSSYASKINDYTSDATATSESILYNSIAYVAGNKVTGTIPIISGSIFIAEDFDEDDDNIYITGTDSEGKSYYLKFQENCASAQIPKQNLASFIGLTADKIVAGNTILGIEGIGKTSEDLQAQLDAQDELIAAQATQIAELKSLLSDKASNISTETINTVNEVLGNEEV